MAKKHHSKEHYEKKFLGKEIIAYCVPENKYVHKVKVLSVQKINELCFRLEVVNRKSGDIYFADPDRSLRM